MKSNKKIWAVSFGVLALGCILVFSRGVFAQGISVHDHDGNISVDANINDEHHRHHHGEHHWLAHVEVDAALSQLRTAQDRLNHAPHDLGDHRTKALRAIERAIAECNEAINFASTHER
jgi:hypothetical protein